MPNKLNHFPGEETRDHRMEKERQERDIFQDSKIREHWFFTGVHPQSAKLDFTFDATDQFEHGGLQKVKIQREPRDFTRVHPQS